MPLVNATEHGSSIIARVMASQSANYLLTGAPFCSIPPAEKKWELNFLS
jgi:hypothetical protein